MMRKRLFFVLTLFAVCSLAFGQKKFSKITAADFATPSEAADSSVDAVYIYEIGDTHFDASGNGLIMQTQVKVRMQIVTEKGRDYANRSIVYYHNPKLSTSQNENVMNIDAASYNLVDGKVVKTSMSSKYIFKEQTTDKLMRLKFSIPEVKVGSIIEYKFILTSPRYADIPTWVFQHSEPVRYTYYTATIPEWYKYHVELRGSSTLKSKQDRTTLQVMLRGGTVSLDATRYTFEGENLRALKNEKFIYCQDDYAQRVDFELRGVEVPGEVYKNYTSTWNDVRKYLHDEYDMDSRQKIKNPYAEEMKSLDLEGKSVGAKASLILAFLKSKLKWNKEYKLYCKNPLGVLKEGKGSNIELNYIYMSMLRDAGIKSTPLLIRARSKGRLPMTYASIDKLNTFVVAFPDENGALLFADCSSDYGDVNVLPDDLMAEGILYDPNITKTPNEGAVRGEIYALSDIRGNATNTRINCVVTPDGQLAGQRINTHIGYNALSYKESYHEMEDSLAMIEKKEKGLECKISSFRTRNAEGVGRAVEERIRFSKETIVDGDKIYFNPIVFADEKTNYFIKPDRVLPVEFPAAQTTTITSVVTLPEGYVVEEMPKPETVQLPGYLAVTITFEMQENNLVTKYQSIVDNTFIPATEYANLQEFWNKVLKINSMMVCLKKS